MNWMMSILNPTFGFTKQTNTPVLSAMHEIDPGQLEAAC
jgi:hypothetical protein